MNTIQQRILDKVVQQVESKGYWISSKADWANTGTLYIFETKDGVLPIGQIGYGFQSDTYEFTLTVRGRKIPSQEGRADYFAFYQKYTEISRFWDELRKVLTPNPIGGKARYTRV